MAERVPTKPRKVAGKGSTTAPAKAKTTVPSGSDRLSTLEAECAALKAKLAEAEARVRMLEGQRELIANRIDWIIDSLHTLNEE